MSEEEDYSQLPLETQLSHKSWKARVLGYEQLQRIVRQEETSRLPAVCTAPANWARYVADSNAVAQDAALSALLGYADTSAGHSAVAMLAREKALPIVLEKCIASARSSTRQKAVDLVMLFIDIDQPSPVIEMIVPLLDAKQPKLVAAAVALLKDIFQLYGTKTANPKPIMKSLSKLFAHSDKNVRAEATTLVCVLQAWLGTAVLEPVLKELKPVQVKELNDLFEQNTIQPTQTRFLNSQSPSSNDDIADAQANDTQTNNDATEDAAPDAFDFADPVDVLKLVPSSFYEMIGSEKWKERKEVLESLVKVLDVPKMVAEGGAYRDLVGLLVKRMNDANILCVVLAAQCLGKLASGLRSAFSTFRSSVLPALLDRLKEKKQNVLSVLRESLDALALCVRVDDMFEDLLAAMANKNPNVRAETIAFLGRCLSKTKTAPKEVKGVIAQLVKAVDDSTPDVREASFACLGVFMRLLGEKPFFVHLEKMDAIKVAKIKQHAESCSVQVKTTGSSNPSSSSSLKRPASVKNSVEEVDKENSPPTVAASKPKKVAVKASSMPNLTKRPSSAAAPKRPPTTASTTGSKLKKEMSVDEVVKFQVSEESAVETVSSWLSESILNELSDSAWKVRLAAMESLVSTMKSKTSEANYAELVTLFLAKQPVWKDNNFQVLQSVFSILELVSASESISKACAEKITPLCMDKVADIKCQQSATAVLLNLSENTSLGFVVKQMMNSIKTQKSPKSISEGVKALRELISQFGVAGVNVVDTVTALVQLMGNSNVAVRSNTAQTIGVLYQFIGPDLKSLLSDLSPAQMSVVEGEIKKFEGVQKPEPVRKQKNVDTSSVSTSDVIPAVDISSLITSQIVENMADGNWKVRKEGLDAVQAIFETHTKIKQTTGDLLPSLRARLGDSNKNLVMQTLQIVASVAKAMGPVFERHVKVLLSNIIATMTDNKPQVRMAAVQTLDAVKSVVSWDALLPTIGTSLATDNPNLRRDVLTWVSETFPKSEKKESDFSVLLASLFTCLQDRSQDVRKAALATLKIAVEQMGFEAVREKCGDLKGAAAQTVMTALESVRGAVTDSASSLKPSSPTRTTSTPSKLKTKAASAPNLAPSSSGLPRPGSSRLTLNKKKVVSKTMSSASVSASVSEMATENEAFVLLTSDTKAKERRAEQDRGLTKWTFEAPRKELIDFLNDQCDGCLSEHVRRLLFSEDHHKERDFVAGLSLIDEALVNVDGAGESFGLNGEEVKARFVAHSDLVFKYLTIRFFDSNTSILLKSLDVVEHLVAILDASGVYLTEYEAVAFLPYFINKVGDNKETIRSRIRSIMRQFCRVYPASKMFNQLLNALSSKNARTRAECLEELGNLIQRNGMNVCNPSKSLPLIAVHIADRDNSVRTAAINTVVQAYALLGDQIFKHLGKISEKERSLLDERIKRSKVVPPNTSVGNASSSSPSKQVIKDDLCVNDEPVASTVRRPTSVPEHVTADATNNARKFSLEYDQLDLPKLSESAQAAPATLVTTTQTTTTIPTPALTSSHPDYMMDLILSQITSGDVYQSIDALKQLEVAVSSNTGIVEPHVNQLVNSITLQLRLAFTSPSMMQSESATLIRLSKHLVNALVHLFTYPQLALSLTKETMHPLMSELLTRIMDPTLPQVENGNQLLRALNVLMLRVLENSNKNHVYSVLLDLLDAGITALNRMPEEQAQSHAKYTELVMKCMWKSTKSLRGYVENKEIDVSMILLDIHKFLTATPPLEWKKRAAEKKLLGDMPLRTVKTILNELVLGAEADVLNQLTLINDPQRSIVTSYLTHMLKAIDKLPAEIEASMPTRRSTPSTSRRQSGVNIADVPKETSSSLESISAPTPAEETVPKSTETTIEECDISSPERMQEYITHVFDMISSKEKTKEGISKLYQLRKKYPDSQPHIDAKLSDFGQNFQLYIRRGLQREAEECGDTVSSSASVSATQETDSYKERLTRLQQMFNSGSASNLSPEKPKSGLPVLKSSPSPPKAPASSVPSAAVSGENRAASVLALKERLAKMKSSMATTGGNSAGDA